jgi:DNA-binding SARP family transcriptional activator/TolB-like protein
MAIIALRLLGSVEMRDARGRELHSLPSQPKRFGLLSYLAVAQPRGFHSRDKLMGLFWPEATREQARHALSQALHVLRSELGEEAFRSRGDTDVAIDEAAISCDAVEFEQVVDDGEYEEALGLYRGDLMQGLFVREAPEFERWLEDERTRLREKAAGAAWALAHEHISEDRLVDAERTAQRALLLVPTDEDEVRRFIQALADAGDRAAAVRFYEKFANRLRSEYDIEPDPATATVAAGLTRAPPSGAAIAVAQPTAVAPLGAMIATDARLIAIAPRKRRKVWIGVAVAAIVVAALGTELLLSRSSAEALDLNRVLVVALADESGQEEISVLGKMAQDYIIQVLTDARIAEVVDLVTAQAVSQNVAEAGMAGSAGEIRALADEARAGTVVSGSYYAEGDSVYIQTRITGAGKTLETVLVVGAFDARSELVARLADAVVAALASVLNEDIGSVEPRQPPATYEAFEAYAEGLEAYTRDHPDTAARHFERAAVADPAFRRATLWAAQSYELAAWYAGDWSMMLKAESLLVPLQESPEQLSRYERCRLGLVIALGRRINISGQYEAARCMVQEAPGSDDAKTELANTLIRLNRPAEAIQVLKELDPDRGLTKTLPNWNSLNLVRAYHMLGEYEEELEAARQGHHRFPQSLGMLTGEAWALAALDRLNELPEVLQAMHSLPSPGVLGWHLQWVAEELRVHGHPDEAREVFDEAIAWYQSQPSQTEALQVRWGWALYYAERWDVAQQLFEELAEEYPENRECLAALGLLAARRGDRAEAARISEQLRSSGNNLSKQNRWYRARIAAVLGEKEQAIALLQQDVDMVPPQDRYLWVHRGIDFESLRDYPPFQEFMRPKG